MGTGPPRPGPGGISPGPPSIGLLHILCSLLPCCLSMSCHTGHSHNCTPFCSCWWCCHLHLVHSMQDLLGSLHMASALQSCMGRSCSSALIFSLISTPLSAWLFLHLLFWYLPACPQRRCTQSGSGCNWLHSPGNWRQSCLGPLCFQSILLLWALILQQLSCDPCRPHTLWIYSQSE